MADRLKIKIDKDYVPHTGCARIALFLNYKDLSCEKCREYYGALALKEQEKWFASLGRKVPADVASACFSQI